MAFLNDPLQEKLDRQKEEEDRVWHAEQRRLERDHEINLSRLELTIDSRRKLIVSIAKVPAWMILALMVPIIALAGKKVPKVLEDFMTV